MGVAYNPKIVTNGLLAYWDVANKKSYPGSGSTLTDLSINKNNGTLFNSPAFSANNGGYLNFTGTQYITANPSIVVNTNTGFTIDMWIRITDPQPVYGNFWAYWFADGSGFEWGVYANAGGQGKFYFKDNSATGTPFVVTPYIGNTWAHLSMGCNTLYPFLYVNTISVGTSANPFRNVNITLSNLERGPSGSNISAYQSSIKIYSRALSSSEITQNYNATKGRFGL